MAEEKNRGGIAGKRSLYSSGTGEGQRIRLQNAGGRLCGGPAEDLVSAPVAGKVVMLPGPPGHAVGIRTDKGVEVLIHIGIDTVELQGEGFEMPGVKGETGCVAEIRSLSLTGP